YHADSVTTEDNKQLLKQRFAEAKCLGEKLNEVRNKISEYILSTFSLQFTLLKLYSNMCWKTCNILSSSHISYRTMFSHLKGLKVEIEHLQLLMGKAKMKLQKDFEVWWSEEARNLQRSPRSLLFSRLNSPNFLSLSSYGRFWSMNILSYFRIPQSSSASIPLTGDSQADADILAFIKARQNILQKKGKSCQEMGSQTKISSMLKPK
uniref:Kinesin-like protein KIF6/9 C-terminal domain-containing protein n=1 Tax=Melopsittacus undulatus TaxID=13146 RepID=A0A8V5FYB4_MELUD